MTYSVRDVPSPTQPLQLFDAVNDVLAAGIWLAARERNRTHSQPGQTIEDVFDEHNRYPGELLRVASRDRSLAATVFTVVDADGTGSTYVTAFAAVDPGEPALGSLVEFAMSRARSHRVRDVRFGAEQDQSFVRPLVDRHGFHVHERWRRFELDLLSAPAPALAPTEGLPDGLHVSTLATRPELAPEAHRVLAEGMVDTPGDFPRTETDPDRWASDHDESPVLGLDQVFVLHDNSGAVHAMVELERTAAGSDSALVEFLAVDRAHRGRGLARLAKRVAASGARDLGLRRLATLNHADNAPICALNESLGWEELPQRLSLTRSIDAEDA